MLLDSGCKGKRVVTSYLTDESNVFIPQFFGECFHILSSFSTPSTFDAQNINTWQSIHIIFILLFGTQIVTMIIGFDNESRKKVSNIKQKLALLSSHRLLLRRLLSRRLQRLNSKQMLNKKSQESSVEFYRILFADDILRIIGNA